MKKLKTLLAVVAMLLSVGVFATGNSDVVANENVIASFKKGFSAATNISWEKKDEIYFANFILNGRNAEAAFNANGDLIALSNSIESKQMPMAISVAIGTAYPGYQVAEKATEITYEFQTNYYINIYNEKQLLKLKCAANGDIIVEKKIKN